MSCVLSKEKVKINNMLPKNHEIASTFGEITLRKDRFDILCFEINCDKFSSCKKKEIQIVCCSCTQRKLREESVPFYTEKRFYDKIDMVFVAPCPRHLYFTERS